MNDCAITAYIEFRARRCVCVCVHMYTCTVHACIYILCVCIYSKMFIVYICVYVCIYKLILFYFKDLFILF